MMVTAEQIEQFNRDGVLVLKGFYDLEQEIMPIQKAIYGILGLVIKQKGLTIKQAGFSPDSFDDVFLDIIRDDRTTGGIIYDAIKQIPAFMRLLSNSKNEVLYSQLRQTDNAGICGQGHGIRIDIPNEEKYRAPWHQDYTAQLRSLDGMVLWSPLAKITEDMGPVQFCLASHKQGMQAISMSDPDNPEKQGAYAMRLCNEEAIISEHEIVAPLTEPGDLVLIDFLTVHASGRNVSNRARWSMQMRYFNFNDTVGLSHWWHGGITTDSDLLSIHPELVKK